MIETLKRKKISPPSGTLVLGSQIRTDKFWGSILSCPDCSIPMTGGGLIMCPDSAKHVQTEMNSWLIR
jgi:hypothetical protein